MKSMRNEVFCILLVNHHIDTRQRTNDRQTKKNTRQYFIFFALIETSLGKKDSGFSSATDATEQQRQIQRKDEEIQKLNNHLKERDAEIQRLAGELKR